jgi:putative transcriptional regulator
MISNLLPQILAQKEVSIRQLARDTGVTYSTIWAMVHGRRRSVQLEVLDAVCEVLDVEPGDIYRRPTHKAMPATAQEAQPAPRREAPVQSRPSPASDRATGRDWRSW